MSSQDITIYKGKTFSKVLRWGTSPYVYKAITAISRGAPARVTASSHGVPDGWRVAIVSAGGMREINAKKNPPVETDFHKATLVDPNTIDLNDVNSSNYTAYTSGGYVQYFTPVDLTSYTARMQIRLTPQADDPPLVSLTTENGGITLNLTTKTITLTISATDTAALTFSTGVYDLELISGAGVVTQLLSGTVTVVDEVTR